MQYISCSSVSAVFVPVVEKKALDTIYVVGVTTCICICARILAKLRGRLRGWRLRRADGAGCEQRREDVQELSKWIRRGGGCGAL